LDKPASTSGLRAPASFAEPRAVVAEVVEVGAVDDVVELPLDLLHRADAIELALAVKAAIGVISGVVLALDLVRVDQLVARADLLRNRDRLVLLEWREAWAHRRHPDRARPEDAVRDRENERAVDPARVADEDRAHRVQERGEAVHLRIEREAAVGGGRDRAWLRHLSRI
jgi:hypothetical protein